jgi:hypothetical protein
MYKLLTVNKTRNPIILHLSVLFSNFITKQTANLTLIKRTVYEVEAK